MAHLSPELDPRCGVAPVGVSRRASRWWLAGLLVTCLLPVSLAHSSSLNPTQRLVQACILAPMLRRVSQRACVRFRLQRRLPPVCCAYAVAACQLWQRPVASLLQAVAAHDVLTRRGPPLCP